ncbi:TPA: 50S ribosomal protein L29 [Candidatus Dependentiae bacterium]|nr:MAG: hypothetical protein UW09_C0001G0181 [candidate division TM6 bacterium GW2011_GWF2_43_87]HBL98458.1 50S ribosomal protein L29 [Candidatus Dependentiae bacterium]
MPKTTNAELAKMTLEQIAIKADELRRELFQLRLRMVSSPVKSFPTDQKNLKRAIARVLTHANQKIAADSETRSV